MWRAVVLSLALLLALAMPAAAQDRAAVEAQFQIWLEEVIWPAVAADGVPRATFDAAFGGGVPELGPAQPAAARGAAGTTDHDPAGRISGPGALFR